MYNTMDKCRLVLQKNILHCIDETELLQLYNIILILFCITYLSIVLY